MTRATWSSPLRCGLWAAFAATLVAAPLAAQVATIRGRVTGDQAQPLGGAIVSVSELNIGAATAPDGGYSLTVAADRVRGQTVTLVARAIGFAPGQQRFALVSGPHEFNFVLKFDPLTLEEVVVTGVPDATSTRKLTFAVGSVNEAQIQQAPAVDPLRALAGKVAGAQVSTPSGEPGAGATVRLRSVTNLTGGASQAPLLIVDGVITYGTLADINAQDIERIEVIKGAAASSLYGSNAASGVIQVFTRRGRSIPEGITRVTLRNEYGQSGLGRRLPLNQSHYCIQDSLLAVIARGTGVCQPDDLEADRIADNPYPGSRPFRDHQSEILGDGAFFTNYAAVSGRQGATNYMASFEYQKNAGIVSIPGVEDYGFGRQTVRINVDQALSDRMDLSFGGFYGNSKNRELDQGPGSPFFSVLFMPPDVDLFQENANGQPFLVNVGASGAIPSSDGNPLYNAFTEEDRRSRTRLQGTFRARWRPLDWMSVEADYAYDRQTDDERDYVPKGTLSASATPTLGSLGIEARNRRAYNTSLSATASRQFGPVASRTKAAMIYESDLNNVSSVTAQDFASVHVPDLDNITNQAAINIGSDIEDSRTFNYFVVQGLDYKDRYIADVLVRRDGSSRFGQDSRWATYYRASAAWRVTQDLKLPYVDELRLRVSRGTAGLRPPFAAQYETFSVTGGRIQPSILGNTALKPAQSAETEIGMNAELLQRFTFEYNYSRRNTTDQILLVPLSAVAGFTSQWQNAGTLFGITHEAAFGALIVNKRNLIWQASLTFDRSRTWITELDVPAFRRGGGTQTSDVFLIRAGILYGTMWGNRFVRSIDDLYDDPAKAALSGPGQAWHRDSVVVNEEGYVVRRSGWQNTGERPIKYTDAAGNQVVQIGDANPDFNVSLSNTVSIGNLTIYGLLHWVKGGDIYNQPRQWLSRAEFRAAEIDQAGKPVTARKPVDYYGAFNDANAFNDYYVESGTYVRLRELSLSYTFSTPTLNALGIGRWANALKVGLVGRNLLTFTNYTGLDPETANLSNAGDPTTFRFDAFSYPNFRTFSGFIEIGF